jgi:hypothetical protein
LNRLENVRRSKDRLGWVRLGWERIGLVS